MYHIYRFLNKEGTIIYLGRTGNMENRMKEHFSVNGHLPNHVYKEVYKIETIAYTTAEEMEEKEVYYIDLYQPKYNTIKKKCYIDYETSKDKWEEYKYEIPYDTLNNITEEEDRVSVTIRVTKKEKDKITELATGKKLTITSYIKKRTIYDLEPKKQDVGELTEGREEDTEELNKEINRIKREVKSLEAKVEHKDERIQHYKERLEHEHKQYNFISNLYDRQMGFEIKRMEEGKKRVNKLVRETTSTKKRRRLPSFKELLRKF